MTGTHFALVLLFFVSIAAQREGKQCIVEQTGEEGKCSLLENCNYAKGLLRSRQRPQPCGFRGLSAIVCCPLTTKRIPGQKSKEECSRHYPITLAPAVVYVYGGEIALAREFPHMAFLAYGPADDPTWFCGGSLISEQFVLTAAHCVTPENSGIVRWVRLGDLYIRNTTDDARPQDFRIDTYFVHPYYRGSSHYHDIALLKLNREVKFDSYVKPACLYIDTNIPKSLTATGWGKTDFFGEPSSHLIKVYLDHVPFEQCAQKYSNAPDSKLTRGILDEGQICAGSTEGRDTCPGDSGGPLQFYYPGQYGTKQRINSSLYFAYEDPHFYIIGVTSFGKPCGFSDTASAGVYTRVSRYIDWIEDTVWPQD